MKRYLFILLLILLSVEASAQYRINLVRMDYDTTKFKEPYFPEQLVFIKYDTILYALTHTVSKGQSMRIVFDSGWYRIIGGSGGYLARSLTINDVTHSLSSDASFRVGTIRSISGTPPVIVTTSGDSSVNIAVDSLTGAVKSDWGVADTTSLAWIRNKPTIPDSPVQSDWSQTDSTELDYIKNKPTVGSGTVSIITALSPIVANRDTSAVTLSMNAAHADGLSEGWATFHPDDFDGAGEIYIDYVNGQKASETTSGFLSDSDWRLFKSKLDSTDTHNLIHGSGQTAYIPWFTGSGTIANSPIDFSSGDYGINISGRKIAHIEGSRTVLGASTLYPTTLEGYGDSIGLENGYIRYQSPEHRFYGGDVKVNDQLHIVNGEETTLTGDSINFNGETSITHDGGKIVVPELVVNGAAGLGDTLDMGGHRITNMGDPVYTMDAVNKKYIDDLINYGIHWVDNCEVSSNSNLTLKGEQMIKGIYTDSTRVLVKDQTLREQNGIYITDPADWTRATDFDEEDEIYKGVTLDESSGNAYVTATEKPIQVGTTEIQFALFFSGGAAYYAGAGLTLSGNTFSHSSHTGDATGSTALTLATVNDSVGAGYNTVTVDAKGRVTSASRTSYLTQNQQIVITGDVYGHGRTSIIADIVDDSHDHVIGNVDYLQDSLRRIHDTIDNYIHRMAFSSRGDLLYGSSYKNYSKLPIGASRTFLRSNGLAPQWDTIHAADANHTGLLTGADWAMFKAKQDAIYEPITGTGTTGYLPKFNRSNDIGDSPVYTDGTNIGIATESLYGKLTIFGSSTDTTVPQVMIRYKPTPLGRTVYSMSIGYNTQHNYSFMQSIGGNSDAAYSPILLNPLGGYIGINNSSPAYPLDVTGDANVTGKIRVKDSLSLPQAGKILIGNDVNLYRHNANILQTDDQFLAPNYYSLAAQGIPPFMATSTTLCTNLNADLVDGKHASELGGVGSVSIASANGFAGTSSGGSTPVLTIKATPTGILKGNGTAISAAVSGTDYLTPYGSTTAKYFLAAPATTAGIPSFRLIVPGDIPTLNQNTTGTSGGLNTQYIDWNATSGGTSIKNKPTVTGTSNYVAKFNSTSTGIQNSQVFDNGTNVGVGTASPYYKTDVNGDIRLIGTSRLYFRGTEGASSTYYLYSPVEGVLATNAYIRLNSNTANKILATDASKDITTPYSLVTTIGATGDDTNIPSEQSVREAITEKTYWDRGSIVGGKGTLTPSKNEDDNVDIGNGVFTAAQANLSSLFLYDYGMIGDASGFYLTKNGSSILKYSSSTDTITVSKKAYFADRINAGSNKIINVADPEGNYDAANKKYVDDHVGVSGGYTAGWGLVLKDGTEFRNARYWGDQDTIKRSISGLVRASSGLLSSITDNSSAWNNARDLKNHDSLSLLDERSYNSLTDKPAVQDSSKNPWKYYGGYTLQRETHNVGIGTTTPGYTLDVAGSLHAHRLNINGAYTFPTSDGSTGYVLQTNGSGTVTWQPTTVSMVYKGTWNANTNTPILQDGTGTAGWYYRVTAGGSQNLGSGTIIFLSGDDVMYNGSIWQRIPGGAGTVSSISVVAANGLSGTVANPTTTPAITLSTTVTGLLKGNGTTISAATPGADYIASEVDGSTTNELQNLSYTASTRALGISNGTGVTLPTFSTSSSNSGLVPGSNSAGASYYLNGNGAWTVPTNTTYSAGTGLNLAGTTFSHAAHTGDVTGSTELTLAGVNENPGTYNTVTVNAKGLVTSGTNTSYITGNEEIDLSGDVSGSGTTKITVAVLDDSHNHVISNIDGLSDSLAGYVTKDLDEDISGVKSFYSNKLRIYNTNKDGGSVFASRAFTGVDDAFTLPSGGGTVAVIEDTTYGRGILGTSRALHTYQRIISGDVGYLPKYTTSLTPGADPFLESVIYDDGSNVGIGTAAPTHKFDVDGTVGITGKITIGASPTQYTLPNTTGTQGQTLVISELTENNELAWADMPPTYTSPLTTKGDILYAASTGHPYTPSRLGIGSLNQVLTVGSSGVPEWKNAATGFTNPMTNVGDMMYQVASNGGGTEPAALAVGTSGYVLTSNGTTPQWTALPAGSSHNPVTIGSSASGMSITVAQVLSQNPSSRTSGGYQTAADWIRFNNKVGSNATAGHIPKVNSGTPDTLFENSLLHDNGVKVTVGDASVSNGEADLSLTKFVQLNNLPDADSASGTIINMAVGAGGVTKGKFVYVISSGTVANYSSSVTSPVIGVVLKSVASGGTCRVLLNGFARNQSWSFSAPAIGKPVYVGSNGYPTETAPTASGGMVQIVGVATGGQYMIVNPQLVTVTLK
jgi:hypothetical protein